jgi:hypothetical protein
VRGEALLFGGARERGAYLADTWTWDGATWTRHDVEGPAARGFAAAAFHAGRGTIVLHGGRASGRTPHADTWEWDGEGWHRIVADGAFASDHHAMVALPTGALLAFGGWDGEGVAGETWLFDAGGAWRRFEGDGPPPRSAFGMGVDEERGVAVLSGGLWIEGQYADVWEWADGRWRAACGPYDNSSLDHHALAWDAARGRLVGFGGKNYRYKPLQRTFALEGGRLRQLAEDGPAPRHSTPLTSDGERVLLYGGKTYDNREMVPLADLWAWDGERWQPLDG